MNISNDYCYDSTILQRILMLRLISSTSVLNFLYTYIYLQFYLTLKSISVLDRKKRSLSYYFLCISEQLEPKLGIL